ncbi:MAG TPA: APC family permease [Candidatus Glassbacteria bacterium]|nr:APC family permease [Candidatus Glassbacteria bacterium]
MIRNGLKREVGVIGAAFMGLGSIIGTGVFVSIGIAAGIAGPGVIAAIAIAAVVASCNGLSSAQLAASLPVSGGTYEYGYQWLNPAAGFSAGWMFLCAKCASAATAALGFAGYLAYAAGLPQSAIVPVALATVLTLTLLVLGGIRSSNRANLIIVSVTLLALVAFIATGIPTLLDAGSVHLQGALSLENGPGALLEATALMFVAYTGYGRIATLGEEVREPRRNIPRAIIAALLVSMILYLAVAVVAVGTVGSERLSKFALERAAPLEMAAASFGVKNVTALVSVGALTAMLGVLLNLILGISRVLLAMGRRGDMPSGLARIGSRTGSPTAAILATGLAIMLLALTGSVKTTWTFSAFTVLIYYAITNLAALRLPEAERLYPKWVAWAGLAACLFLAFWVETRYWLAGVILIAAGLGWKALINRLQEKKAE